MSLVPHLQRGDPLPARSVLSDIGHEVSAYDTDGYWIVRIRRPELGPNPTPADHARAVREQRLDWQRFERVERPVAEASRWRKGGESPLPAQVLSYLSSQALLRNWNESTHAGCVRLWGNMRSHLCALQFDPYPRSFDPVTSSKKDCSYSHTTRPLHASSGPARACWHEADI